MAFQCELKQQQAAQPILILRTRTKVEELPQFLGRAYGAVAGYLGAMGKAPAGPPFAGYHNMDMQNLDVEAGFPVSAGIAGQGEIQASEIPGGNHATCFYKGSYQEMAGAYEALTKFIQDKGYKGTGTTFEMYLNDPANTAPQDLETLIVFPLE
jgi:effector-binding domain-containing protein